jgi:hypothetical protein
MIFLIFQEKKKQILNYQLRNKHKIKRNNKSNKLSKLNKLKSLKKRKIYLKSKKKMIY